MINGRQKKMTEWKGWFQMRKFQKEEETSRGSWRRRETEGRGVMLRWMGRRLKRKELRVSEFKISKEKTEKKV